MQGTRLSLLFVLMGSISLAGPAQGGTIQFRGAISEPSCQIAQVSQSRGVSARCSEAGQMTTRIVSDVFALNRGSRIGLNRIDVQPVFSPGNSAANAGPDGYIVTLTHL